MSFIFQQKNSKLFLKEIKFYLESENWHELTSLRSLYQIWDNSIFYWMFF